MINHKKGLLALSPLLVFILLYLVTSIVSGDFYKVPITVAFMVASIFAIIMSGGFPLNKRIEIYSKGASTDNMMMMLWIFVLAGAFANAAKQMGSIDATVNMTLSVLPSNMLLAGLFLASCFISISIGTSVGTIVPCHLSLLWSLEVVSLAITCRLSVIQRSLLHAHKSVRWLISFVLISSS